MDVERMLSALARVEGHGRASARKPHESWAEVYGSRTHPRPRKRPCNDFEDREAHRGPSTSLARRSVTSRTMPRARGARQSGGAACRPALCLLHSSHEPVRPGAEAGRRCAVYGVVLGGGWPWNGKDPHATWPNVAGAVMRVCGPISCSALTAVRRALPVRCAPKQLAGAARPPRTTTIRRGTRISQRSTCPIALLARRSRRRAAALPNASGARPFRSTRPRQRVHHSDSVAAREGSLTRLYHRPIL